MDRLHRHHPGDRQPARHRHTFLVGLPRRTAGGQAQRGVQHRPGVRAGSAGGGHGQHDQDHLERGDRRHPPRHADRDRPPVIQLDRVEDRQLLHRVLPQHPAPGPDPLLAGHRRRGPAGSDPRDGGRRMVLRQPEGHSHPLVHPSGRPLAVHRPGDRRHPGGALGVPSPGRTPGEGRPRDPRLRLVDGDVRRFLRGRLVRPSHRRRPGVAVHRPGVGGRGRAGDRLPGSSGRPGRWVGGPLHRAVSEAAPFPRREGQALRRRHLPPGRGGRGGGPV